jgi:SAM-dependent methyltransferase
MADDSVASVVGFDSAVHHQPHYWNDHEIVRRHLHRRATGDPDVAWYHHAAAFAGRRFRKALVLNCGNGWVERDLILNGIVDEAIGVDGSADLLDAARAESDRLGLPARYYETDVNAAAFPEDGYDVVVNHAAAHRVTHLDRVFRSLRSLLPPDGWLVSWDYVGPHRNQYPAAVMEAAHGVNLELPEAFRATLGYPHLPTMLVTDPTEAVHSELARDVVGRYFEPRHERALGGAVAYQLLTFNEALFGCDDAERDRWVSHVVRRDEELTDAGAVPTLFSYLLAQPRPGPLDPQALASWSADEEQRERTAAAHGGVYYPLSYVQQVTQQLEDERVRSLRLANDISALQAGAVVIPVDRHAEVGHPVVQRGRRALELARRPGNWPAVYRRVARKGPGTDLLPTGFPSSPWAPLRATGLAFCNICRWSGRYFGGRRYVESQVCPRCGSVARDRVLFDAFVTRMARPSGRLRVLETSPRLGDPYRRAMGVWFDYTASDFDERAHRASIRLDLQELDLPDASLDVVLSAHVLEHVPDTERAVAELYRVLAPGGRLLLQVPMLQGVTAPPVTPEFHGDDTPVFWRFGFDLADRLRDVGFRVGALCAQDWLDVLTRAGGWPAPTDPYLDVPGMLAAGRSRPDDFVAQLSVEEARRIGLWHGYQCFTYECLKELRG